jgi:hypothetical protein
MLGKSPRDYLKAISQREIQYISLYGMLNQGQGLFIKSEVQKSPDAHIALYEKFLRIVDHLLPCRNDLIRPTIWHWDIHAPNIFVDGGRISCLIDWQNVWTGPLFLQVKHPRLVDYNGEILLKLPEGYENIRDKDERQRIRNTVERSIVLWSYESATRDKTLFLTRFSIYRMVVHGEKWLSCHLILGTVILYLSGNL